MTVFHQFSSVVMVTVCMETALMTPVIALRTQRVFTAKSCKVCTYQRCFKHVQPASSPLNDLILSSPHSFLVPISGSSNKCNLFLCLHCTAPASPPVGIAFESKNFTLSWQPPQGYEPLQMQSALRYSLLLENSNRRVELTTDLTSFVLEDLSPDTRYCVSVRTVASGGFGVYSGKTCFNTSVAGDWHYLYHALVTEDYAAISTIYHMAVRALINLLQGPSCDKLAKRPKAM